MRDLLLIGSGIIIGSLYWIIKRDMATHRQQVEEFVEMVAEDLNETVQDIASSIEVAVDESDTLKRKIRNSKAML